VAGWLIRTFTTDTGGKPVDEWIESLDVEARVAIIAALQILRVQGNAARMPLVRHLEQGLWELRARDSAGIYRVIYFHWKGRTLGLLHGFTKRTRATPRGEILLALDRRAKWLDRAKDR